MLRLITIIFIIDSVVFLCSCVTQFSGTQGHYELSILDFGADPEPHGDDSDAFRRALSSGRAILVPEGVYRVSNVEIVSKVTIRCSSLNSIIQANNPEDAIFYSNNATFLVEINGGTWQKARSIIHHRGRSAFSSSRFEKMYIRSILKPFEFSSSIGNRFEDLHFGDMISQCIIFGSSSEGQNNINRIRACNFLNFDSVGINFVNNAAVKVGNIVEDCWFENSRGTGIILGSNVNQITIKSSYFERVGAKESSDIIIGQDLDSRCKSVFIRNCAFQGPNDDQLYRIIVNGKSNVSIQDNSVVLGAQTTFVRFNSLEMALPSKLESNILNAKGAKNYRMRLFSTTSEENIFWNDVGGRGVQLYSDQVVRKIYRLDDTNIPDVSQGNYYYVYRGAEIENFRGGMDGLLISLLSKEPRRILKTKNIDLNGSDFLELSKGDNREFIFTNNIWMLLNGK